MSTSTGSVPLTSAPAEDEPGSDTRAARRSSFSVDRIIALLGLVAIALIVSAPSNPVIGIAIFLIWLIVPGWATTSRLRIEDPAARAALTVVASAVVAALVSLLMVWTALWYPRTAAVLILLASVIALGSFPRTEAVPIRDAARRAADGVRRRVQSLGTGGWVQWAVLAAGFILWAVALSATSKDDLDDVGRIIVFPPSWYVGVALVFLVALVGFSTRIGGTARTLTSVGLLNLMLFASSAVVQGVPQLPWAYKHIAVANYIDAVGSVNPDIDLYNRWPAFFSTSAFLGRIAGYPDPVDWAAWCEAGFALIDVIIVYAIARALTRSVAVQFTAILVFTVGNWVGQNYYAPQAFGYTLYLTMCLIAITYLRGTPIRPLAFLEEKFQSRRFLRVKEGSVLSYRDGGGDRTLPASVARRTRVGAIAVVLALQCVIVVSHQLTPYLAIACLVPLFFLGYLRPSWVGLGLLGAALLFLLINFEYVNEEYGLITGFDLVENASYTPDQAVKSSAAEIWHGRGVAVLALLVLGLGVLGLVRKAIAGNVRLAIIATVFALAPAAILAGQSYGGEGRFRVYLFALPWLAIGVGWLFDAGPRLGRLLAVGRALVVSAMLALFVLTSFQAGDDNRVRDQDVEAAQWLDAQLQPGDLLMGYAATFPTLIGENYPVIISQPERTRFLADFFEYTDGSASSEDVKYTIASVGGLSHTYLFFPDSQRTLLAPEDVQLLDSIEAGMKTDPEFELVYDRSDVRIYRLDSPSGVLAADDFGRETQDGWAAATTSPWAVSGEDYWFSVEGDGGLMTLSAPGTTAEARLSLAPSTETNVAALLSWDRSTTGGALNTSVAIRATDTADDYRATVRVDPAAPESINLDLVRRIDGEETVLATSVVPDTTFSPETNFTVDLRAVTDETSGTTSLTAKLWRTEDTVEPAWSLSAQDDSPELRTGSDLVITSTLSDDATRSVTLRVEEILVEGS